MREIASSALGPASLSARSAAAVSRGAVAAASRRASAIECIAASSAPAVPPTASDTTVLLQIATCRHGPPNVPRTPLSSPHYSSVRSSSADEQRDTKKSAADETTHDRSIDPDELEVRAHR